MKTEYEIFDTYLQKSKQIRVFCDDREKMMFEVIRMDISEEAKIHWLNLIGNEFDKVLNLIEKMTSERKSFLKLNVDKHSTF